MTEPIVLDSSGEPSPPTHQAQWNLILRRLLRWLKSFLPADRLLALLALFVIAGQLYLMKRQTAIADRQTAIAQKQFDLAAVQQELVTRPNVELRTGLATQKIPWKLINNGPYKIINVKEHDIHFKKFIKSGWETSSSSVGLLEEVLEPGQSREIPYAAWLKSKQSMLQQPGDVEIPGTAFMIMEIHFQREVDNKEYLLIQPVVLVNGDGWIVSPSQSTTGGPLKLVCGFEAYAVELIYEYYRRNPLPYPAELYNFHYLLGNDPGTECLNSSRAMKP